MIKVQVLYYTVLFLAFSIGAFFLITYAAGYQIDIKSRKLSQTGMIIVDADNAAKVYLDGTEIGSGKITKRNLLPKNYDISIKREGYYDWSKRIELTPGEAEIINDNILFRKDIKPEEYKIDKSELFSKLSDSEGISTAGGELYQNGNFVTRFSTDIKGASWYSDRRYIAYTYANQLRIIEIDGTNEQTLVEKKSDSPVFFLNSGRQVIYESDGKIYRATIR